MSRWLAVALGAALLVPRIAEGDELDPNARWIRWRLSAEAKRPVELRSEVFRSGAAGGGALTELPGAGRIDLTAPGAIAFAMTPERWRANGDYVPFVTVRGAGQAAFIIERARPDRADGERLLVGFFELRGEMDFSLEAPLTLAPGQSSPREIRVSWDATGFAVSVSSGPFVRKAVPRELVSEAFGNTTRLVIGSPRAETTAIDSLRVYGRALE